MKIEKKLLVRKSDGKLFIPSWCEKSTIVTYSKDTHYFYFKEVKRIKKT